MIVRKSNTGWHIVYQSSHGLLAGQLAQQLKHKLRPMRWVETVTAIIEHDDCQLNYDERSYLNEAGMPMDFTEMEDSHSHNIERAKRIVEAALIKSGWVALLISMHIDFLYSNLKTKHSEYKEFLKKQTALRKELRQRYKVKVNEVQPYYELLRFCDRCSLILCQDKLPAKGRKLEINQSIGNRSLFIFKRENGTIGIEPWCFETERFEVEVEIHILNKTVFSSNKELKEALKKASVDQVTWEFVK